MIGDHESFARQILTQQDAGGAQATLEAVTIGMSEASVFRAVAAKRPPRFVKVATGTAATALRDEIARTQWLAAHGIAVPPVQRIEEHGDTIAVLMAAIPGVPADVSTLPTPLFIDALAKALAAIHALSPDFCPFDETLAARLQRATAAVAAGNVDAADFEPRNRGTAPAELLRRLQAECPRDQDSVVLHGDATLGNIMIDENGKVGFIDCGNAGRGDRYTDLALLHADIVEHRGAAAGEQFLLAYGAGRLDTPRARYFLDLYELF